MVNGIVPHRSQGYLSAQVVAARYHPEPRGTTSSIIALMNSRFVSAAVDQTRAYSSIAA
jgi:hypothetical protein